MNRRASAAVRRQQQTLDRCVAAGTVPEYVSHVADAVTTAYVACRRRTSPGYCASRSHRQEYMDAALEAMQHKVEPAEWVNAQFAYQRTVPYPNNLHGQAARDAFKRWTSGTNETDVRLQLTSYANIVQTWKRTTPVETVLRDTRHGFPPLFVWCIAKIVGLEKLAAEVESAARQMLWHAAYCRVYAERFADLVNANGTLKDGRTCR